MMKKYLITIFITLTIAGSSCKKDYLNLTNNPNVPSVAAPNLLLSGALKTTADIVNGGDYVMYAAWVGYLSQSTSFQPFTALEQYLFTTSSYQGPWTDNYLNISNYNGLLQANAGPNYNAIAQIMMAYDYEALVDNFNNVPFSQALQGAANLNPAYDSGPTIYLALMKQLDAAITAIQGAPASAANPLGADIMFGGNMTNWIKFANTLKLRLCIRESTNPSLSTDEATLAAAVKATAGLGYLDGTTMATVNPGYANNDADGGQQSPLWKYYGFSQNGGEEGGRQQYQANTFAANFFFSNNDPRLVQVYSASSTPNVASATITVAGANLFVQGGIPIVSTIFGASTPPGGNIGGVFDPTISPSLIGPGLLVSASQNAVIMSGAESLFLQAEATAKGILPGAAAGAATLYDAAITSSFEFDQVPNADAAAAAYYAQPAIAYPTGGSLAAQVTAIITQKWAALDVYGAFEAFNEERRTGVPVVPLSVYNNANPPNQVARIFYPFVEYQTNAKNVAAQGTINPFSSQIFWALSPANVK
jgi:hypothetical protein